MSSDVVSGGASSDKLDQVLQLLALLAQRMGNLEERLTLVSQGIGDHQLLKEWYSTSELAELVKKSDFTVREKWCNQGRIACEKDPDSGKWRIPGDEVRRLQNGGALLPRQPR
jgi:hypothetical protein